MAITTATTGNLADAQRILVGEGRYTAEHAAPMKQLVSLFRLKKGEKQLSLPQFGQITANALTDAVDMVSDTVLPTETTVTITTSEVGAKIILTDKLVRQMNEDVFRVAGKLLGNAMGRKLDKDLLALLDGFSNALGAAATAITAGHITAAIAQLKGGLGTGDIDPAPDPIYCMLHPHQVRTIMNAIAPVGTYPLPEGPSADILRKYFVTALQGWGIPIFGDGNLTPDSSDDAKGGVFSKEALYLCWQDEWDVENERDASLRATELVIVADYGVGELRDAYGMEMYFDAAAPTS